MKFLNDGSKLIIFILAILIIIASFSLALIRGYSSGEDNNGVFILVSNSINHAVTPTRLLNITESTENVYSNTSRSVPRTLFLNHASRVVELKQKISKVGLELQLKRNTTVINASFNLTGLPSFDYKTWDELSAISMDNNDKESKEPAIAVDNNGTSHIVWEEDGNVEDSGNDWDIIYSYNTGETWQPYEVVSIYIGGDSKSPDICIDSNDKIHMVWSDETDISGNGNDWDIFYRYRINKGSWSSIQLVSDKTGLGESSQPKIAVNSSGDLFIVWKDNEDIISGSSDFDILCKVWHNNNKTWSSTIVLSDDINDGESIDPDIIAEGDKVYAVWSDDGNISGSGVDYDIILRTWNGSAWENPLIISDDVDDGDSKLPAIDVTNRIVCVVWNDTGNISGYGTDNDIILKRFNGTAWSAQTVISTHAEDSSSTNADVDIDRDGNVHVVWDDDATLSPGDFLHIVYRRWEHTTNKWSSYILISDDSSISLCKNPRISVNNDARVEIVWMDDGNIDSSGTDPDIICRGSKFIYPSNLKLNITPEKDSTIDIEYDWLITGELKDKVLMNEAWLVEKLNNFILEMEQPEENYYLVFASDTNGSIEISDFKIEFTTTPSNPTNLRVLDEDIEHVKSHTPVLAWNYFDDDSTVQDGFEIEVGSALGLSDIWNYKLQSTIDANNEFVKYSGNTLLDNQTYYFRVRVKDPAGAWSLWSQYMNFSMNAKPEVTSLTPVTGTADDYIDITWSGFDGNGDALQFTIQANYSMKWYPLLNDSNDAHFRLNTSSLSSLEAVDFRCKCFDGYEYSDDWYNPAGSITIFHNNPPSVVIITPPNFNAVANDSYNIQWESFDLDFGDTHTVNIYYDIDTNFIEKNTIVLDLDDTGSYTWDSSEVQEGNYYICIEIFDDKKSSSYKYSEGIITINHSKDTNPPRILETKPIANSINFSVIDDIRVRFNEEIYFTTSISEYYYVKDSLDRFVEGDIYHLGSSELIFRPDHLDYSQTYTVTVGAGIKDIAGNSLDGNEDNIQQGSPKDDYIWKFSTTPWGGEVAPPHVLSVSPRDLESEITIHPVITATFSNDITLKSLSKSTIFVIDYKGDFIDTEIYFIDEFNELRISFLNDLEYDTKYTILITAEVQDLTGHGLDGNRNGLSEGAPVDNYVWSFTTKESEKFEDNGVTKEGPFISNVYILILIFLVIIIFLWSIFKKGFKREKFVIHDIFVIYDDGRVLAHQSFESRNNVENSAMGGMLTAIQNFVTESFQDIDNDVLEEIKYGRLKIILAHGKNCYLAAICSGDIPERKFSKDMKSLLSLIELKFGKVLIHWDGSMKKVREIRNLIKF